MSPAVRDALALRRALRRSTGSADAPETSLLLVRGGTLALPFTDVGLPVDWQQRVGIGAYIADPPVELPMSRGEP